MKMLKLFKPKYYIACLIMAVLVLVLSLTGILKRSDMYLMEQIAIAIILAVSLSFVVGFLGELSLGHAGFMCIGAYIGGKAATILTESIDSPLLVLIISVLIGGVCAALAGAVIGLPALRLKGDYLAIVTLAFGEIVRVLFLNSSDKTFGGAFGLETPRYDYKSLYIICFVFAIICVFIFVNMIRSKHGRSITAIRDNEIAAKATGVPVTKYKMEAFILSAFFAGIAGVLYSFTQSRVQSPVFDYNKSIEILVMVVLGGMGSVNGSILAASLITFLNVKLSTALTGSLAVLQNMVYALVLILVVIYGNAPALRSFRERFNLKKGFEKIFHRKKNPGTIRSDEGSWDRIPTKIKMDEILSLDLKPDNTFTPDKKEK